jgi:hypothetical protein
MWQAPNQKARVASTKKGGRGSYRRPIHVKRITAEIRTVSKETLNAEAQPQIKARILLNDLSPKGIGIFATAAFQMGQEIAIALPDPMQIYLRGKVVWCQEHDLQSHVISETPFSYRVGIQFLFADAAEEAAVKKFCDDITRSLMPAA